MVKPFLSNATCRSNSKFAWVSSACAEVRLALAVSRSARWTCGSSRANTSPRSDMIPDLDETLIDPSANPEGDVIRKSGFDAASEHNLWCVGLGFGERNSNKDAA